MRTFEEKIIKWLSRGIQPTRVKYKVLNALNVEGKRQGVGEKKVTHHFSPTTEEGRQKVY